MCHEVYFIVYYGLNLLSDVLGEDATVYVQWLHKDVNNGLPSLSSHSSQSLKK
jgi:hypothetical protein